MSGSELVMAWAQDRETKELRYIMELGRISAELDVTANVLVVVFP